MISKKWDKYIKEYEQHCKRIEQATHLNIHESPADRAERIKKLEGDYVSWFEYYFPMYAKVKCSWYHKKMANWIIKYRRIFLLLEIFRSGAKSVHADMGIPLFLYVKKELKFMLLVGETEPKARKLISDVQAQLQYNQRFINDYGRKYKYGDWADGDFTTTDGVKFTALGFGQSTRGVREGSERPDYIVLDDIDKKKRCNNDRLSREAYEYAYEDVRGCFDEGGERQRMIVANNNFHKNTVINQLKKHFAAIAKLDSNDGDDDTQHKILSVSAVKNINSFKPNWPEKTSANYWRKKFEKTPYRSFMREYMNTHIQDGTIFKHENIIYKQRHRLDSYDGLVIRGDLSYKDTGDFKAMALMGKKGREFEIIKSFCRQTNRAECAIWLYNLYEDLNLSKYNISYKIEGLFAMDEFVNDFDIEGDKRGYHIPLLADKKTKANKFDRIESIAGYFERKQVSWDEKLKDDPDTVTGIDQLLAFEKGSGANDDYPDVIHDCITDLNEITFIEKFEPKITSRKEIITHKRNRY